MNAATERATGVRRDDLIGTDFSEYFTEPEKARAGYRRAFSEGKVLDYPLEIRHLDGHTLTVLYNAIIFHDSDGNIGGVFAAARDITERTRAENALQKSEMRYRAVIEHANEAIIVVQDAIIKFANPKAQEIIGNTDTNIVSRQFTDFIHPDDMVLVRDRYQRRMRGENPPVHYDFRIVSEDSLIKWVQISAVRFEWEGRPATLNFLIDITERKQAEEVLRESEEKYRFLIDNIEDIIWEATPDLRFTYLSPATEKLTGYPVRELIGKSLFSILTENSIIAVKERLSNRMRELIDGRKDPAIVFEVELLKKEGDMAWLEVISKPLFDPGRNLRGFQGTSRDITGRKQAEYALRESEGKFRSMVDTSPDMIWEIDNRGNFTYISSQCEVQLGYEPQDLIGKPFFSLIQPEVIPAITTQFTAHGEDENTFRTLEVPARRRDGGLCIIEIRSVRITGNDGHLEGFRGIARDITERKLADEILQENQARLATAMDIADLVNWEFDISTGLFSFNDRFYTLYDTTAEREGGYLMPAEVYIKEFVHPADIPYVTRIIRDVASVTDPDYSVEMEHRIIRRDGQIRYLVVHFGVVMDSAGKLIRTYGANQDITDRKLMEEEIRSLNQVLEQRVADRTGQLNAMLTEKELLLREIHHRVKNNLQIIVSLFNLQSRYISDQKVLDVIRESQSRVRAMALVHERIYRSENVASVDLKEYLTFLGEQVFHYHGVKPSQIKLCLTMPEIRLDVDTGIPLGLIVNELLSNSLKHAFPDGRKGTISILFSTCDENISLVFSDDGVGFPAGLDWKNSPSLGLRLIISLVRQLNGTIELDPSPGTTFRITATRLQPGIK